MIPPRNPFYRQALAGSHNGYGRVEVWRLGVKVEELAWVDRDEPYTQHAPVFLDGGVKATLGSQVTRTLSLTVPEWLFPWRQDDLLNPYGQELRAFRGIRYGNNSPDEFPVFVGSIESVTPPSLGVCKVEAADVALAVSGAGFPSPTPSQVGTLVVDEFERLVLDANPRAVFGAHDAITELVPVLSYDDDRGSALDSLARTASANWYSLSDGAYVMRRLPWLSTSLAPLEMRDGPGGVITRAAPLRSRSRLFNAFLVVSDRADGGQPLYAYAEDDDPSSPTYVDGPFGVRTAPTVRVTGATNQGQLLTYARNLVKRTRSMLDAWQVTCVPDGSIELGEALSITYRGQQAYQYVQSFNMPLGRGQMSVDCGSLQDAEVDR